MWRFCNIYETTAFFMNQLDLKTIYDVVADEYNKECELELSADGLELKIKIRNDVKKDAKSC